MPDWKEGTSKYLNRVTFNDKAYHARKQNKTTEFVELTLQDILNEIKTETSTCATIMDDTSVVYYRDVTDKSTYGLPHKDENNVDVKREKNENDMEEYWEQLCGLKCKCYQKKLPSQCKLVDKTRITDVGDTFVLDLTKSLFLVASDLESTIPFPEGEYMHYLQCKVWPKDFDEIVKLDYQKIDSSRTESKSFELTGMVLKESSHDVNKGHYMAAKKIEKKWFFCDDMEIKAFKNNEYDICKTCYPTSLIFTKVSSSPIEIEPTHDTELFSDSSE